MINLKPFLLFDGNCAEAMTFYQSCLGGDMSITKVGDTPMKHQAPPDHQNKVAIAELKSGVIQFTATDWRHPTRKRNPGNTVCMYLSEGSYKELRAIFDKLAVGADEALVDDLREMPFGSYGHLADKFGVHWFFHGQKNAEV